MLSRAELERLIWLGEAEVLETKINVLTHKKTNFFAIKHQKYQGLRY